MQGKFLSRKKNTIESNQFSAKKIEIFHSFKGLIRSTVVNLALINGHLK